MNAAVKNLPEQWEREALDVMLGDGQHRFRSPNAYDAAMAQAGALESAAFQLRRVLGMPLPVSRPNVPVIKLGDRFVSGNGEMVEVEKLGRDDGDTSELNAFVRSVNRGGRRRYIPAVALLMGWDRDA